MKDSNKVHDPMTLVYVPCLDPFATAGIQQPQSFCWDLGRHAHIYRDLVVATAESDRQKLLAIPAKCRPTCS